MACARLDAIVHALPLCKSPEVAIHLTLHEQPMLYYADPLLLQLAAFTVSGVFPILVFFGGTLADAGAACALGLVSGLLDQAYGLHPRLGRLSCFLSGLCMGCLARLAHAIGVSTCTVSRDAVSSQLTTSTDSLYPALFSGERSSPSLLAA